MSRPSSIVLDCRESSVALDDFRATLLSDHPPTSVPRSNSVSVKSVLTEDGAVTKELGALRLSSQNNRNSIESERASDADNTHPYHSYGDYSAEVADLVTLKLLLPTACCCSSPDSLPDDKNGDQPHDVGPRAEEDCLLQVPAITLTSQQDPWVFYRIPVGFGLWDAAHALGIFVGERWGEYGISTVGGSVTRVLELGCGAAPFPAIVAAKCMRAAAAARSAGGGPSRPRGRGSVVVVSDLLPDLTDLAGMNMGMNGFREEGEESRPGEEDRTSLTYKAIPFGFGNDVEPLLSAGEGTEDGDGLAEDADVAGAEVL